MCKNAIPLGTGKGKTRITREKEAEVADKIFREIRTLENLVRDRREHVDFKNTLTTKKKGTGGAKGAERRWTLL